jgi:hypothetical protein
MDRGDRLATNRLSRRRLIQGGAGLLGVSAWGGVGVERAAAAKPNREPKPIPGGFAEDFSLVPVDPFIHVLPPLVGFEISTITDFKGVVGAAEMRGTASGGDVSYDFDADMRFMKGQYITVDGQLHNAAFAFV